MKIGNIEVYGVIYKITNMVNGKCYIGQTVNGLKKRYKVKGNGIERIYNYHIKCKKNGIYHNAYLLNSIEKYGFNAFEVIEIFDVAFSKEELDIKEKHYIQFFDSRKNGYNCTDGGYGAAGRIYSDEERKKRSESLKGRQLERDVKDNISEGLKEFYSKNTHPMYGRHHSEKSKRKMSEARKDKYISKNSPRAKSVICLTTMTFFYSAKDASDYYKTSRGNITQCCRGNIKYSYAGTLSDGTKLIWMYLKDFLSKCEFILL